MKKIYYTDSSGKKHKIVPFKSTLSFPYATGAELKALKKELAEKELAESKKKEDCPKCKSKNLTLLRESEWKEQFHCQDCLTSFTVQKEENP